MIINHIDCFSGPGGICTGFTAAGIHTVAAIEKVESCVQTYSTNHPEVNVIHKDIRDVSEEDIKVAVGNKKIHIVTSGMPCETFSTAGAKSRSSYDYRQQLYSEGIRIAKIVDAELILFENVTGILSKKVEKHGKRLIIDDIIEELEQNGYKNTLQIVLKAVEFGVPQTRERYFILAAKSDKYQLKAPTAKNDIPVTVKEALASLKLMEANDPHEYKEYDGEDSAYSLLMKNRDFWKLKSSNNILTSHKAPKHRPNTIERFKLIETNESLVDIFRKHTQEELEELQSRKIITKKWFIQRNKRLSENEPSKTVTSHCLDELVHPQLNRALTVRECARLQSFPDDYVFEGPYIVPHLSHIQDKYEQIGDAVPPLLAYAWGEVIIQILNNKKHGL